MKRLLALILFAVLFFQNGNAQTKYDEKIVFSKSPISETPDDSKLTDKFEFGEKVYGRFFLPKNLTEYPAGDGKKPDRLGYTVHLFIDDKAVTSNNYYQEAVSAENKDGKTFGFLISFSKKDIQTKFDIDQEVWTDKFNSLSAGEHKIKYTVHRSGWGGEGKKPIANGEFTITKKQGATIGANKSFADVKAKKSDAKLEGQAIETINKYLSNYGQTATKVKIVSDWEIGNSKSSGTIVSRLMDFAALVKNSDGSCQVWVYRLQQQYNGKGYEDKFMTAAGWVISTGGEYSEYNWNKADCN
jgi:hypothetical protein